MLLTVRPRLRVMVKMKTKSIKKRLRTLKVRAFFNSGQYQMIFGTGTVIKITTLCRAQGLQQHLKINAKAEAAKTWNCSPSVHSVTRSIVSSNRAKRPVFFTEAHEKRTKTRCA